LSQRSDVRPRPLLLVSLSFAVSALVAAFAAPPARSDHPGLALETRGKGEPTLVLIHGLGMDRDEWDRVAPLLEARHKLVAIELPGHGASAPLTKVSVTAIAQELDRTLRHQKIKNPVLVGHSYGALVALEEAAAHPGSVRGVITIDLGTYVDADSERIANLVDLIDRRYPLFIRGVFESMTRDSSQVDSVLTKASRVPRSVMSEYFQDVWKTDLRPRIQNLKTPVLVVATDIVWPSNESWEAAQTRLGYQTAGPVTGKRIYGSGHLVPLDQPDTLAAAILDFTASLKKK
jgi:pimeloyl-ACP methyl ester carboxylesterase